MSPQVVAPARGRGPTGRSSSVPRPAKVKLGDAAPPVDRKNVGKVPLYLQKRQAEAAEEKNRAARPASPKAPAGYRKVEKEELDATLAVLNTRKKEAEKAQRNLPFKIETPGQKQREKDLNDRVAHLDKLIGMFSRPTVFIPADAEPIASSVPPLGPDPEDDAPRGGRGQPPGGSGSGMRDAMNGPSSRPSSRDAARGASPTPEKRKLLARRQEASVERERQVSEGAPWDRIENVSGVRAIKTGVKIAAPPGGGSSLNLGWD